MSVAEWEREIIAERTREALAEARESGIRLGRPIVISDTTGIRVASDSTSSNGSLAPFSGVPQLPQ